MRKRFDELTLCEAERAAPLAAALRAHGVEPMHAFMPPYRSASAESRRWRQDKSRAFKQAEAARRRGCGAD